MEGIVLEGVPDFPAFSMGWPKRPRQRKKPKKNSGYFRLTCYALEEILPLIQPEPLSGPKPVFWVTPKINAGLTSVRLQQFKRSTECVRCGLRGAFFALETSAGNSKSTLKNYHFNLYGICPESGVDVLMTRDHILPASRGGSNALVNQQTMCSRCNVEKGNKLVDPVSADQLRPDVKASLKDIIAKASLVEALKEHAAEKKKARKLADQAKTLEKRKLEEEAKKAKKRESRRRKRQRQAAKKRFVSMLSGAMLEDQFLLAA